jgi:hypothetical protein
LIGVYFRRLKINHDFHEFILESGTVANTNTVHIVQNIADQAKLQGQLLK